MQELKARLKRNTQLRYAQRELEMQRALMGKGGRRKISGVTLVENKPNAASDDDDARDESRLRKKVRKQAQTKIQVDEKTWKPRVYKWRFERKR